MNTDKELLYHMIYKRKSFHLFFNTGKEKITQEELTDIEEIYKTLTPLYPEIKTKIKIVKTSEIAGKRGQEYCILLYSEKKENYLQNMGYLGEQLDLYLVLNNIGTLWLGMGKTKEKKYEGLDYVIMFGIAKIDNETKFRKDLYKAKRKSVNEIWSGEQIDGVSEIARFAPSAVNSQPWRVEHIDGKLKIYRYRKNGKTLLPEILFSYFNRIDMGIFLYFLELCLEHKGINYNRTLYHDDSNKQEKTLLAVYELE